MFYNEYLNSARKHQFTCEMILQCVNNLDDSIPKNKTLNKKLLLNTYYLSGYIIECSVKYGIYHSIGYDRKACVKNLSEKNLTYTGNIKHHRFDKYVDHLIVKHPGIPLIDNKKNINPEVIDIYRLWDADVRYWFNDIPNNNLNKLNATNINSFFSLSSQILEHVQNL